MTTKVEPTVEKWEEIEKLWRYARKPPTAGGAVDMKMPKQIFIESVIDLISHSVQEAKAERDEEWIKKLEDIFDCPYVIAPATCPNRDVSRAEEAPEQVVGTFHMSYAKYKLLASIKQEESLEVNKGGRDE